MVFTRKRNPILPAKDLYIGNAQTLVQNHHYKYLGINLSPDLSWTHHILFLCKKARKLVGMLHRNFSTFASSTVMIRLYKSLIRPHLEYACIVWDPHLKRDILKIERVQKFALRVCSKKWRANYDRLLNNFRISTLYGRRKILKLCTLFCIFNGAMSLPSPPISIKSTPYSCRHCNNLQLLVPHSRSTAFLHSFFVETIESWNNLPFDVSTISSLSSFKFQLKQVYLN